MTFVEAIQICLRKFVTIKGRASRAEFWYFYLFTLCAGLIAGLIDAFAFGFDEDDPTPIGTATSLALLVPTITAAVRRHHDTGRSGWRVLVPIVGLALAGVSGGVFGNVAPTLALTLALLLAFGTIILQIVWLARKGEPGMNKYGLNPLEHPNGGDVAEVFE